MKQMDNLEKVMEDITQIVDAERAEAIRNFILEYGDDWMTLWLDSLPTKDECEKMIAEVTQQARSQLDDEQLALLREILEDVYLKGKSFAEALHLTEQNLEDIYKIAYNCYNAGQYLDAKNIFLFLTLMDREESRYYFGAGASYHMLKDYQNAIAFYTCCTMLDLLNPLAWYHLGDCYMHLNEKNDAKIAFDNVLSRTKTNPIYNKIRSRSKMMIDKINAEE